MKKISKTKKIAIVALAVLILSGGAYIYFFSHINAIYEELLSVETEVAQLDNLIQKEQEKKALLEETKQSRELLQKQFVSAEDPTPFLQGIEKAAQDVGVTLEIERVEAKNMETNTSVIQKELVVNVTVSGGWEGIYTLLSLLEAMPYVTTLTNTTVRLKEGESMSSWEGQIELHTMAI